MKQLNTTNKWQRNIKRVAKNPQSAQQAVQHQQKQTIDWQWEDGSTWKSYDQDVNQKLEVAYQKNKSTKYRFYRKQNKEDIAYLIDFISMKQTNTSSKWVRNIKRIVHTQDIQQQLGQNQQDLLKFQIQWAYEDQKKFVNYDNNLNQQINQAFQLKQEKLPFTVNSNQYEIDFNLMVQKNQKTSFLRNIKGVMLKPPIAFLTIKGMKDKIEKALFWIKKFEIQKQIKTQFVQKACEIAVKHELYLEIIGQSLELIGIQVQVDSAYAEISHYDQQYGQSQLQYFNFWKPIQSGFYFSYEMPKSQKEYKTVEQMFKKSINDATIETISVIQNTILYQKFQNEISILSKIYKQSPKIEQLFHGTRSAEPVTICKSEIGFDDKYASEGYFGKGIYFAVMASYSYKNYAHKVKNENKHQIFLCDVIVGKHHYEAQRKVHKHPPKDPQYKALDKRFDSIYSDYENNKMYIIYENSRAYPTYIITYVLNN